MKKTRLLLCAGLAVAAGVCQAQMQPEPVQSYREEHRPQFHYSPKKDWMNDPNGMVYYDGAYHLFYQHDNMQKVFGNMSWGHAVSTDLVHWKEYPKAIVPDGDSLGLIFSGSAVVDKNNSAGFGAGTLVAFYTGTRPRQQQCMAYSTDKGRTWTKYTGNPVIKNGPDDSIPEDFRDPKVMWHEGSQKWIMSLAVQDHIEFWSSANLKEWKKEGAFGQGAGSHGGVWECPDLFELPVDGNAQNKKWVLLVSINPGGPNGGSATQYFIGNFDGNRFVPDAARPGTGSLSADPKWKGGKWVDYGTDNYAGVTWSNTGNRVISLGWMSNWQYAGNVPTGTWRGANTFPRELGLKTVDGELYLTSEPVKEINKLIAGTKTLKAFDVKGTVDLSGQLKATGSRFRLDVTGESLQDFSIVLSNELGEELVIGYDGTANEYFIDRRRAGKTGFEKGFGARHTAPRLSKDRQAHLTLLVDAASVELFADNGLTVMTDIFFPGKTMSRLSLRSEKGVTVKKLVYSDLERIWK